MNLSFDDLSQMRKYWIRMGHKNVPHSRCSCHYTDKDGKIKTCAIHTGFYWRVVNALQVFLFRLRLEAVARALESYRNTKGYLNAHSK